MDEQRDDASGPPDQPAPTPITPPGPAPAEAPFQGPPLQGPPSGPAYSPGPPQGWHAPPQVPAGRANPLAFAWAVPIGLIMTFVLTGIQVPRSTRSASFVFGQCLAFGLIAGAFVGLIAFLMTMKWRWWMYVGAVAAASAGFFAYTTVVNADPTDHARTTEKHSFTMPESQGAWTKVNSPEIRQQRKLVEQSAGEQGIDLVYGAYRHGNGKLVNVIFIGMVPDEGTEEEIEDSPAQAVLNYADGAGIKDTEQVEAGPLGGAMRCGTKAIQGSDVPTCAWVSPGVGGMLILQIADLDANQASELARQFRDLAEH